METKNFSDVIVVGGGPGGTTAATLLRRRGKSVTLFEREQHPRFHIGESLLPKNLPILEKLGVLDAVDKIGVYKPGADFNAPGSNGEYVSFPFARALEDSPPHAYQIRRSEFDELLFRNCQAAGVDAREGYCVNRVELDGQRRRHRVMVTGPDGVQTEWTCTYLIDASGRDTLLASQEKWKSRNPRHASAAMFSHFRRAVTREGTESGNISVYWFDGGWIWMIPLRDDTMSVGAVCTADYFKRRDGSQDEFLIETLKTCPGVWERLKNAEQLMPAKATGNYSYLSSNSIGDGFALIGDAYAFIDPVFSSGVYLAMSSAENIVPVAEAWLDGNDREYRQSVRQYTARVTRGINTFAWFIYRFTTPGMVRLFREPRNIFRIEEAVTSMLAGDVYDSKRIQLRLWIFKLIYAFAQKTSSTQSASADPAKGAS